MGNDLAEGDWVDVGTQTNVGEGNAPCLELACELPRAGLVLVQHEEPDVPAACAQVGQELEQVRLGAGDARDLLRVENDAVRGRWLAHATPAASRTPRAHDSTEWLPSTRSRSRRPSAARSARSSAANARIRPARASAFSRGKRWSESRRESKTGFEASTGTQLAAAS